MIRHDRKVLPKLQNPFPNNRAKVISMPRLAALLLAVLLPGIAAGAAPTQTANIVSISDRSAATGGTATLRRDTNLNMFRINLNAVGLTPNHAYVLLLVAFNNPLRCKLDKFDTCDFNVDSNAQGGNPLVTSTTVYLTGGVAAADGTARFNGKLEMGAVGLAGREVLEGTGVYNLEGAQLQVIIRDMGPTNSGVDEYGQTTNHGFGCNVNTCSNVQIVTFD